MKQEEIALEFNNCINEKNLDKLGKLMTSEHRFIDSLDSKTIGKENCLKLWKEFFRLFPDYKNTFNTVSSKEDTVILIGYSTCSDERLNKTAIWTAKIKDEMLEEWRIYDDTANNRKILAIN